MKNLQYLTNIESTLILLSKGHYPDGLTIEQSTIYAISKFYIYQNDIISLEVACENILNLIFKFYDVNRIKYDISKLILNDLSPRSLSYINPKYNDGNVKTLYDEHFNYYKQLIVHLFDILSDLDCQTFKLSIDSNDLISDIKKNIKT